MKLTFLAVVFALAIAIGLPAEAAKRARPPKWSPDVQDAFFDDARTKLDGPRPNYDQHSREASPLQRAGSNATAPTTFTWSTLVSPTTLETEIKRLAASLDTTVTTPSEFKAGGYKSARRDFSELAILFAVIGQYDEQARWQDIATGMRSQFARAGLNAKVGTDQTFREAAERKQDLTALVRGERPTVPKTESTFTDWSQVSARPPLMQRMNEAHEERLTKWLADDASFRRNRDAIHHEAQIVALLAEVIHREAYDYSDDETFAAYARELRDAATETATAAADDNFDQARAAINRATGTCTNCHAGYRG